MKADIESNMISFASNGGETPGYLSAPTGKGEHAGIVILQEWWGLVGHIKDVGDRFAREGFVTLAPDLYHGETADEPNEARKLAMALDRDRAVGEIAGAARYLLENERVQPKKIGVVGWCMGGGLCLSAAAEVEAIGAAVVFYGRPLEASDTVKITAPVLGLYGELDQGIPVSMVKDFEAELEKNSIPHEINIYPGAQHAFFNEERPQAYAEDAAEDAWKKTLDWLGEHLTEDK